MYVLRGKGRRKGERETEGGNGREGERLHFVATATSNTHTLTSSTANLKESLRDRKAFSCDSEEEEDKEEEPHSLTTPDLRRERGREGGGRKGGGREGGREEGGREEGGGRKGGGRRKKGR